MENKEKEQQDRIWNELSESRRTHLKSMFINDQNGNDEYTNGYLGALIDMFGEHNLNPKPPTPKTWEEVIKLHKDYYYIGGETSGVSDALKKKAIATLKIAKLIDLGYGGMMTEIEWKDERIKKYCVVKVRNKIESDGFYLDTYNFISFHTPEQREEFMSYESNRQLVNQYFMM